MRYKNLIVIYFLIFAISGCTNLENQSAVDITTEVSTETMTEKTDIVAADGGTLNVAIRNPKNLNPLINEDESIDEILKLVYDDLIVLDENQKPSPNLVESWEFSQDGRLLTLRLRNDVYWHNGNQFTSNDVKFSIDTIKNSADTSPYKTCIKNISSYQALDSHTFTITYSTPFSGALQSLNFPIISYEYYIGQNVLDCSKNMQPMGTGAYEFTGFSEMKQLNLKRNPRWFKAAAHIEDIEALIIPKEEAELYAFDQGKIDFLSTDIVDWEKYNGSKKTNIYEYATNYYEFIGINFNNSILNDTNVRQALAHAVPKDRIIEEIYLEHAIATDTPIHPKSWLSSYEKAAYDYNGAKSKQLLSESGWTDTDQNGIVDRNGYEFRINMLVNSENPQRIEAANMIKRSFQQIGVDLTVDIQNFNEYSERLRSKNFDLAMAGWKLSTIPDLTFAFHSSQIADGDNFISYNNPSMDLLLQQAYSSVGDDIMREAYKNIEDYISEQLPYISLYFKNAAVLIDNHVKKESIEDNLYFKNNVYSDIDKYFIVQD